jgi:hypothetical protein
MSLTPTLFLDNRVVPDVAPRWRNLYFVRDGRTIWGSDIFDSAAACRVVSGLFFDEWTAYAAEGGTDPCKTSCGQLIPFAAFRFAIPFPV